MSKRFKRSEFDDYISGYTIMNLLNCICVIIDRLLPLNDTPTTDFKWMAKFLSKLISHKMKHTTHYPD
jgi:hypothetical protein